MTKERISLGNQGEQKVSEWLISKGYTIIGRNVRYRTAEIDLIARHPRSNAISFIEVRTRQNASLGHPLETISAKKQANIRKAAELFLLQKKISNVAIQFDVASIVWARDEFIYIDNAF